MRLHLFFILSSIAAGLTYSGPGRAQLSSQSTTQQAPSSNISATVETSYTSNLVARGSDEESQSLDLTAIVGISNNSGNWNVIYNGSKDLLREREYTTGDGAIAWSNILTRGNLGQISLSASVLLPLSEASSVNNFLYTRLTTGPKFTLTGRDILLMDAINLSYAPLAAKSFHQYTTSRTGASNNEYSFIQQAALTAQLNSRISLSLFGSYTRHWTYERNTRDAFLFDQSIGWSITPNISLTVGHNNQGNALAANGADSGVEIYDINSSTIYTTLGIGLP